MIQRTIDPSLLEWPSESDLADEDTFAEAPGGLVFKTAADVTVYMEEEKESWGRCTTTSLLDDLVEAEEEE